MLSSHMLASFQITSTAYHKLFRYNSQLLFEYRTLKLLLVYHFYSQVCGKGITQATLMIKKNMTHIRHIVDTNWHLELLMTGDMFHLTTLHHMMLTTHDTVNLIFFNIGQKTQIVTFCLHIWNRHGKYIRMSRNKPRFGPVVLEIAWDNSTTKIFSSTSTCRL